MNITHRKADLAAERTTKSGRKKGKEAKVSKSELEWARIFESKQQFDARPTDRIPRHSPSFRHITPLSLFSSSAPNRK
jgi:hypothetical protein